MGNIKGIRLSKTKETISNMILIRISYNMTHSFIRHNALNEYKSFKNFNGNITGSYHNEKTGKGWVDIFINKDKEKDARKWILDFN